MTKHAQRLTRLAHFQLLISGLITVGIIIFVAWPAYAGIVDGQNRLNELAGTIEQTDIELNVERDTYRDLKESYALQAENNQGAIGKILPTDVMQTEIVRIIEAYANSIKDARNPVLLKTINFGKVIAKKDVDYVTLPFKLTINTSKENLHKILRQFERSGSFIKPDENITLRLLDTRDINIQISNLTDLRRFAGEEQGSIDVDISMYAYALPEIKTVK